MNHNQDSTPMRPYGAIPDPHAWARNQEEPPWCRPDVPINLPAPGRNSNVFHPEGPGGFPWMDGIRRQQQATRICEAYLLAYIKELRRQHAEEWLKKDDDLLAIQAINQSLAKQALAKTEPAKTTGAQGFPTTPKRGVA